MKNCIDLCIKKYIVTFKKKLLAFKFMNFFYFYKIYILDNATLKILCLNKISFYFFHFSIIPVATL